MVMLFFFVSSVVFSVQKFEKQFPQKMKARYLKIVAKNFGKLPEWHQGKGGEAFIFVDELELR